jgi:hypothetical protein
MSGRSGFKSLSVGALNKLPSLNSPTESETNQATGTEGKQANDSKVVSMVSDNSPALRTFQDVKTESEHSPQLVSPMESPKTCPKGAGQSSTESITTSEYTIRRKAVVNTRP